MPLPKRPHRSPNSDANETCPVPGFARDVVTVCSAVDLLGGGPGRQSTARYGESCASSERRDREPAAWTGPASGRDPGSAGAPPLPLRRNTTLERHGESGASSERRDREPAAWTGPASGRDPGSAGAPPLPLRRNTTLERHGESGASSERRDREPAAWTGPASGRDPGSAGAPPLPLRRNTTLERHGESGASSERRDREPAAWTGPASGRDPGSAGAPPLPFRRNTTLERHGEGGASRNEETANPPLQNQRRAVVTPTPPEHDAFRFAPRHRPEGCPGGTQGPRARRRVPGGPPRVIPKREKEARERSSEDRRHHSCTRTPPREREESSCRTSEVQLDRAHTSPYIGQLACQLSWKRSSSPVRCGMMLADGEGRGQNLVQFLKQNVGPKIHFSRKNGNFQRTLDRPRATSFSGPLAEFRGPGTLFRGVDFGGPETSKIRNSRTEGNFRSKPVPRKGTGDLLPPFRSRSPASKGVPWGSLPKNVFFLPFSPLNPKPEPPRTSFWYGSKGQTPGPETTRRPFRKENPPFDFDREDVDRRVSTGSTSVPNSEAIGLLAGAPGPEKKNFEGPGRERKKKLRSDFVDRPVQMCVFESSFV
ncbi:hypothetical protein TNCT_354311 [Trichonephila clavata]|uniref:Uncharacterized protein n=1 Tax=Trichonephila clavata TaxID=2740835 RepID=A0A8X6L7C8_TRICU|nr:hypothetical protein TNCT_354311 [Trichonephila clavata]